MQSVTSQRGWRRAVVAALQLAIALYWVPLVVWAWQLPPEPPALDVPGAQTAQVGQELSFVVTASDPNNDIVGLTMTSGPPGATFAVNASYTQGTFSWTPTAAHAGGWVATFEVVDMLELRATADVPITVPEPEPPALEVPGAQQVQVGEDLEFVVTASDPNDDLAGLGMATGPPGATLEVNASFSEGEFHWRPTAAYVGEWVATFEAVDALGQGAAADVAITVLPAEPGNTEPTIEAPSYFEVDVEVPASFDVFASDEDGDPLTLAWVSEPVEGAEFVDNGDGTGTFTITAPAGLAETGSVLVFQVTDGRDGSATAETEFAVNALPGQNPPEIDGPGDVVAPSGETTEVVYEVTDADEDLTSVTVQTQSDLDVSIRGTASPRHRMVVISPKQRHEGMGLVVTIVATDAAGHQTTADVTVAVPGPQMEVNELEVVWSAPPADDPLGPPPFVEVFSVDDDVEIVTGDAGELTGYAVYASEDPDFEPSPETLVAVTSPTWRNTGVTLTTPLGKTHRPFHVKVTSRNRNGESAGSKNASTNVPRFPDVTFKNGKLVITAGESNILEGALLDVRTTPDVAGEQFVLQPNKKGTKWVVKKRTRSSPSGLTIADALPAGQLRFLVIINPGAIESVPLGFSMKSP